MSVQSDLGPSAPARGRVYAQARELVALALLALELAGTGPRANVPRAIKQLDRMRAVLGEREAD